MPYLAINGVSLPVVHGSLQRSTREVGSVVTSYNGTTARSRRTVKRDLSFEVPWVTLSEAFAWDSFLRGTHEVWSFDSSFYSSKGGPPAATSGCSIVGAPSKYGGAGLQIANSSGYFRAPISTVIWTAMWWQWDGAAWHHLGQNNYGDTYVDGVFSGAPLSDFSSSSNYVQLAPPGGSPGNYDDLAVFPIVVPDPWLPEIVASVNALGLSPKLTVSGDAIPEPGSLRTMICSQVDAMESQAVLNGTFQAVAKLKVTLSEE